MVLPTLHSYSATKHLTTPQEIIQTKQEIETEKKIERAPTRLNSAHSKWASPISGKLSDEALRLEQEKQEKSTRLEQRRSHLSAILEAEKTQFQTKISSIRQSIPGMKIPVDSLRSAHEKERQTIANEKLYDHQIINNSDSHSIDPEKFENLQLENFSEELTQRLDEHDRQIERQKRIGKLKIILQEQMNEIKQKEEELELLKQDEEYLLKEQQQLDQYEEERKQMKERYIQQDSSRRLLRQHKAKLHKRAKEIQEQLELDINILSSIVHADEQTRFEESEERKAINILKQFEQQMKLEQAKEQELDAMFQEEAAKQWSRREQEWNFENKSREKLMRQVMDQRQEQIMEKLEVLKQQQQEIYERQRTLIHDMEQARKYDLIEKQKLAKEREEKKKISIVQQERTQSQLELEKQDALQTDYNNQVDQLVQKQKPVITTTTIEPKFYGRRRVNWN